MATIYRAVLAYIILIVTIRAMARLEGSLRRLNSS